MPPAEDFLRRMAAASRARARTARARVSEGALLARARALPPAPALSLGTFDVIAELKLRSPAAGGLADSGFDRGSQIEAYARGGAAAVSVLTEPDEFNGSLEHLREAAERLTAFGRPAMRKDFLTDPYQVVEARAAGAGGVLVIVTMLDDAELDALLETARELALFVLLEGFDAGDLARIEAVAAKFSDAAILAGVNSRNLKTLEVDFERFAELAPRLPRALPSVAESGIGGPAEVERVAGLGYGLALVGSALMHETDPARAVTALLEAGRAARSVGRCS